MQPETTQKTDHHPVNDNLEALRQGLVLLDRIDEGTYTAIGPHVRHVIDHYAAFFSGFDGTTIDYDARQRNRRIETEREAAQIALVDASGRFADLDRGTLERPISVRSNGGGSPEDLSRSTLRRELQFLVSHTVHHWALVRSILTRSGIPVAETFGVAPSTLRYREEQVACAPQAG
ncbi:MAG: hypothetical protein ABJC13_22705 [Acidobacteriota bacterium]